MKKKQLWHLLSGGRNDVSKQSVSEWSLHQILTGGQSYLWEQTIPIPPTVSDTFMLYPCRKIRLRISFHPTPRIHLSSSATSKLALNGYISAFSVFLSMRMVYLGLHINCFGKEIFFRVRCRWIFFGGKICKILISSGDTSARLLVVLIL